MFLSSTGHKAADGAHDWVRLPKNDICTLQRCFKQHRGQSQTLTLSIREDRGTWPQLSLLSLNLQVCRC